MFCSRLQQQSRLWFRLLIGSRPHRVTEVTPSVWNQTQTAFDGFCNVNILNHAWKIKSKWFLLNVFYSMLYFYNVISWKTLKKTYWWLILHSGTINASSVSMMLPWMLKKKDVTTAKYFLGTGSGQIALCVANVSTNSSKKTTEAG